MWHIFGKYNIDWKNLEITSMQQLLNDIERMSKRLTQAATTSEFTLQVLNVIATAVNSSPNYKETRLKIILNQTDELRRLLNGIAEEINNIESREEKLIGDERNVYQFVYGRGSKGAYFYGNEKMKFFSNSHSIAGGGWGDIFMFSMRSVTGYKPVTTGRVTQKLLYTKGWDIEATAPWVIVSDKYTHEVLPYKNVKQLKVDTILPEKRYYCYISEEVQELRKRGQAKEISNLRINNDTMMLCPVPDGTFMINQVFKKDIILPPR